VFVFSYRQGSRSSGIEKETQFMKKAG